MDHTEICRKLSAYLDNAVNAEEKEEIKRHLGSCGNCRGVLADLEWTIDHLKRLPEVEPPPWLTAKIMAKVRESSVQQPSIWQRLFFPLRIKLPLTAFLLIFLAAAANYLVRTVGPQLPQVSPPQVSNSSTAPPTVSSQHAAAPSGPPVPVSPNAGARSVPAPSSLPASVPAVAPAAAPTLSNSDSLSAAVRPVKQVQEPELQPTAEWALPDRTPGSQSAKEEKVVPHNNNRVKQKKGTDETLPPNAAAGASAASQEAEFVLSVDDPGTAAGRIEQLITQFGGRISGHSYSEDRHLLFAQVEARKIPSLFDRLGHIGTVQARSQLPAEAGGKVDLLIKW